MKTLVILLNLFSIAANAQRFDSVKISAERVTENIYMLKGDGGNIGILTGPDGVLMIDNQYAPLSEKITIAIKALSSSDIKYVINTHVHGDHSGGNENFKKRGAAIVAHQNVRFRMMKERVNDGSTIPPRERDAWPVISFNDRVNFHLNDEDIEIIHFGYGHTDGDAIVYFKKANVLHAGDLFVRYGYPYIDTSQGGGISGFIDNLDKILSLINDQSRIIPGHGELANKADVKLFRDRLADIRDTVSAALKKGRKVEEVASLPIASKYDSVWGTNGFIKGKDFVLMVANTLQASNTKSK